MPSGDTFDTFRGEEVCVGYDVDLSGPGSGAGVEWWFTELSGPEHEALKITPDEEQAIVARCIAAAEERR